MPVYRLPASPPLRPPVAATTELAGEDVAFTDQLTVGAHGDWMTVTGADASKQSVRREHLARPGSLARRPEWGIGAGDAVFQNMNRKALDELASKSTKRMRANPRVAKVVDIKAFKLDGKDGVADVDGGIALRVEYIPVGAQKPDVVVIRPPGVR